MARHVEPLPPERLRACCDSASFAFDTTADLDDLSEVLGQERAVEAIQFALGIRGDGYNLFALGSTASGKEDIVREFLERQAAQEPTPSDWVYVFDFADSERPRALELPAGRAVRLRQAVEELIDSVAEQLPIAFESDSFRARKQAIEQAFKERQEIAIEAFRERARTHQIELIRAPLGMALAPVKDGEVLGLEDFSKLPTDDQRRIETDMQQLQDDLKETLRQVPRWEREQADAIAALEREVAAATVAATVAPVRQKFADLHAVVAWIDDLEEDLIEGASAFVAPPQPTGMAMLLQGGAPIEDPTDRYAVNVLVDHSRAIGAPVVYEDHPTFVNLVGRVEHVPRMGALTTDFSLIRAGALHRANGGYLVLDARKVLTQPFAWDQLKRALTSGEIRIESPAQAMSMLQTVTLEPDPIPLKCKVVLVGERELYYMLAQLDPDFPVLFKVPADFEEAIDRTPDGSLRFARMLGTIARKDGLRPLDRGAVAAAIEHGARLAGDAEKLTTGLRHVADLVREADFHASKDGRPVVSAEDVRQAVRAQIRREGRVRDRVHEMINRGDIHVDTHGARVGQVNALSVMQLGQVAFGRPNRITASIRLGQGQVVDIEREVRLGGPLHTKGVLILTGFLGQRFASDRPLSLSASLVFEQSYAGVDGDSASLAELCALLSALGELPVRQDVAMTGSVDQHGTVQPIGGVNEKIEGFFDVCSVRGLTGTQGVLIPATNVRHLMLRDDVVDAARRGLFHVWPVATVDEAIELLTGLPCGQRDHRGNYPADTVNRRVEARLVGLADRARSFLRADGGRRPADR